MGTQRVQMKGVLPWLVRWARRVGTRDFYPALAALVSPVQNFIFFTVNYFNLCVLIAQQPGQAVVQGRLSLNVCPFCYSVAIGYQAQFAVESRRRLFSLQNPKKTHA
jgi:hypothetical protein